MEEENMVMAKDLKVRIDRLETMRAAHIHVLSETPHGYEFFLTVGRNIEQGVDIDMSILECRKAIMVGVMDSRSK
jgi:hypothetical protein